MTTEEFKKKYPDKAHLEGNALWDAMEDSMLQGDGDIMEDGVLRWKKGDPDIKLSPEDEVVYQQYKKWNDEAATRGEMAWNDYNRVFWQAFDKPQPKPDKPLSTATFMIFDISDKTETEQ